MVFAKLFKLNDSDQLLVKRFYFMVKFENNRITVRID